MKFFKILCKTFIFFILPFFLYSVEIEYDLKGGYYYLNNSNDNYSPSVPDIIEDLRASYNHPEITDNPLFHGAVYVEFRTKSDIADNLDLFTDIVVEHRGFSYGVYSTGNLIVYPKFLIAGTLPKLKTDYMMGNRENFKLMNGLVIYNLDAQVIDFKTRYNNLFSYRFSWLGDLINGIGLGMDDLFAHIISMENLNFADFAKADVSFGFYLWDQTAGLDFSNNSLNFASSLQYSKNIDLNVYSQQAMRDIGTGFDPNTVATLFGSEYSVQNKKTFFKLLLENRFYGKGFLQGLKNEDVFYRESYEYDTSIGEQLYPISRYERPFSQFAVFAEYQGEVDTENISTNVWGTTIYIDYKYDFYKSYFVENIFDINYIISSYDDGFWYPFYTIKLGVQPEIHSTLSLLFTNKTMNLNLHYPSFDYNKNFFVGFSFKREI